MLENTWEKQELVRLLKSAPGTQYQEAADYEKTVIRDWVRTLLQTQEITVTFTKADGSIRDMRCTLDWGKIPEDKQPKNTSIDGIVKESKKQSDSDIHSIRVFDVEKNEWRSFRFERLQKITAELNFS